MQARILPSSIPRLEEMFMSSPYCRVSEKGGEKSDVPKTNKKEEKKKYTFAVVDEHELDGDADQVSGHEQSALTLGQNPHLFSKEWPKLFRSPKLFRL
jgi:hypothetical protein